MLDAERFRHRHSHYKTARLERASREPPFVLHKNFAATQLCGKASQAHDRRHHFAEAHDILGPANRQHFAVAPEVGRARGKHLLGQSLADACKIVTDQQWFSGARQIVHLVSGMMLAGHRAFQVSDKTPKFGCQVIVVLHGQANSQPILPRGARNTTKCESEKLTAKLTRMEISFASTNGNRYDSANNAAVLDIMPATPDAANAA